MTSTPDLLAGETTSSTSYKARIICKHVCKHLEHYRSTATDKCVAPLMVAMQGPQGCGKTTLTNAMQAILAAEPYNVRTAVLSLDDLYLDHNNLVSLAKQYSHNALLSGRGQPGTHDILLATKVLTELSKINQSNPDGQASTVDLPVFDKSLFEGAGDRSERTVKIEGPIDVFFLEGWSMGFSPLGEEEVRRRYQYGKELEAQRTSETVHGSQTAPRSYMNAHPVESLIEVDNLLSLFAKTIYPSFSVMIQILPETYSYVFDWRLQQEHMMKAALGESMGMTDEQVRNFVERYMPGYELWADTIRSSAGENAEAKGWIGRGLGLVYGKGREVVGIEEF